MTDGRRRGAERRILVGQFFHETHGFNPQPTREESISTKRGASLISSAEGTGTTLGGIVARAKELGWTLVPTIGFLAQPSGPIDHGFYTRLRDEFIAVAQEGGFEAIALDMHGAMGTTILDDADADLLTMLRAAVGPAIPIGIGLDMHAHVTTAMLQAVDVCISCKECPHIDFPETGRKVIDCLDAVLDGRLVPVRAMAKAPMVALDGGFTALPPFAEIKARAEQIESGDPSIWDISLCSVYRFGDFREDRGQAVLVLSNNEPERAVTIAEHLAGEFWKNRERFQEDLPDIGTALDRVLRETGQRPFVLADMGDRVLAGAPGDGTAILASALKRNDGLIGAIPVTDPASVAVATAAGIGAEVELAVGGGFTPGFTPLILRGVVKHLGDGSFTVSGPFLNGEAASLGRTAVILVGGRFSLLLTSEPGFTHTPTAFTSQGIDIAQQDFVVSKSSQHFQANFAGVATPLIVATPGLSFPTKGFFPWRNGHFWPEEDIQNPDLRAHMFTERNEQWAGGE